MHIKNRLVMIFSLVLMASMTSVSFAKYYSVDRENGLNHVLDTYDLVVILFYNKKMAQEPIKQTFKELSRGYSYHEADVAFVSKDIAREDGVAIARKYGVRRVPTLLLFQDGRLVIGKDRVPLVATDVKTASDMRLFINTSFGDRIEDVLREREERNRIRCRRGRRSGGGFRFGISYGYPYYPYYGYPFGYSYGYPILYGF